MIQLSIYALMCYILDAEDKSEKPKEPEKPVHQPDMAKV